VVNFGVAMFCWIGSYLLFDQSSWLMVLIVMVVVEHARYLSRGKCSTPPYLVTINFTKSS
jgi:hypothetical protein